jgi:DNA-binding transcriptional regulator YiaG
LQNSPQRQSRPGQTASGFQAAVDILQRDVHSTWSFRSQQWMEVSAMRRRYSLSDRAFSPAIDGSPVDTKANWEQPPSYEGALFPDMED